MSSQLEIASKDASELFRFELQPLTSSNITIVVLSSKGSKSSPSTSNVEQLVGRLKVELLADELELVVLEFLESLGSGDVLDDSGGVDHPGSEEPREGEAERVRMGVWKVGGRRESVRGRRARDRKGVKEGRWWGV